MQAFQYIAKAKTKLRKCFKFSSNSRKYSLKEKQESAKLWFPYSQLSILILYLKNVFDLRKQRSYNVRTLQSNYRHLQYFKAPGKM